MQEFKSILMSMQGNLRFNKEGIWLHDERPVTHRAVAQYFSRHIGWSKEHECFVVEVENKCVKVSVEDTPHVVREIITKQVPWQIRLDSDLCYAFDPNSLEVSDENVFYCRVPALEGRVRILRAPHQLLLPYIHEHNSSYYLIIDEKKHEIRQGGKGWR